MKDERIELELNELVLNNVDFIKEDMIILLDEKVYPELNKVLNKLAELNDLDGVASILQSMGDAIYAEFKTKYPQEARELQDVRFEFRY